MANSLYRNNGRKGQREILKLVNVRTLWHVIPIPVGARTWDFTPGAEPPVFSADMSYHVCPHVLLSTCIRSTAPLFRPDILFISFHFNDWDPPPPQKNEYSTKLFLISHDKKWFSFSMKHKNTSHLDFEILCQIFYFLTKFIKINLMLKCFLFSKYNWIKI